MTLDAPLNAIVVVVDRLSAGYLGPYGNTWVDTRAFNRLASQSTLFENVISDSPSLDQVYGSYWHGSHAALGEASRAESLAELLSAAGVSTGLLTDSPQLSAGSLSDGFGQRIALDLVEPAQPVDDVEQTHLGQLFAETVQWIGTAREPFMLWVHAGALDRVWDAPLALRAQFADEEDPPPSSTVSAPNLELGANYDPDELLGFVHAYAGQVAVLDLCLAALLNAVERDLDQQRTLVVVTAPRGFALGEHGCIGACGDRLQSEILQVPCLVRHPHPLAVNRRCQTLIQPPDLYAMLLDWFGQFDGPGEPFRRSLLPLLTSETSWTRQAVYAAGCQQLAVRTPIWFLVSQAEKPAQLFVKPDDRWEVNEVADLCQPIADQLCQIARRVSTEGIPADLQLPLELLREE